MTLTSTMVALRLADRSLRRYATRMAAGGVDAVLHRTYVAATWRGEPLIDKNRASVPLFKALQENLAVFGSLPEYSGPEGNGSVASGSGGNSPVANGSADGNDLDDLLASLPPAQRAALLLTALEGFSVQAAGEILGLAEQSVALLVGSATEVVNERLPALNARDPLALGLALGDLPVEQATPTFWTEVEDDLTIDPVPSGFESMPVDHELAAEPFLPPPETSIWPAVWAGAGAFVIFAGLFAFVALRSGDDQLTTGAVLPVTSVTTGSAASEVPDTSPDPNATSATNPSSPRSVLVVPPAAAAGEVTPPSAAPTTPTTEGSTAAPTPRRSAAPPTQSRSESPAAIGPADRGDVAFTNGSAIITSSLNGGATEFWRVELLAGQTLSISVLGLNGVDLAIYGPDGVALPADYADSGLLVITATGPLNLLFTDFSGSGADYSIGMGIAGGGAGFLAMMDPDGVAVSTPVIATCSSSPEALEATMTVPGTGQQIAFRFETGTEPNTVSFLGSREAVGQIRSMTPVPTGLVVSGTIVVGPDAMLGFPFWLGVYGCEATA